MRILVTGANGQLGKCIQDLSSQVPYSSHDFIFTDIHELNICISSDIETFLLSEKPDVIINAAAYTAVDQAEEDVDAAYKINRDAVYNLAQLAQKHNIYLVHISTDYVFSGTSLHPYKPSDPTDPCSIYGKSKKAGEEAIFQSHGNATILRTSWLYSEYGKNFLKTMLHLGKERKKLNVVYDQIGAPTYAGDLAKAILSAIETQKQKKGVQVFHYANKGVTSWYDFAYTIFKYAKIPCTLDPILTSQYPAKAIRPAYSVFDLHETEQALKIEIPHWTESLRLIIKKLQ